MKQKHRIFGKELWTEMMMSFFVCTACICILEGVVGTLFMPRQQFGYEAFFSPPLFGAVSVLFGIVTRSRRELSMGEVVARRCLHLLLIEGLVFGLNYAAGARFTAGMSVALAFAIAIVFVTVYVVMYINDRRNAISFNEELKKFQCKIEQEMQKAGN